MSDNEPYRSHVTDGDKVKEGLHEVAVAVKKLAGIVAIFPYAWHYAKGLDGSQCRTFIEELSENFSTGEWK